ncbi:MAG: phospholipase domain-containing protein [Asticcacaulis sp.]
MTAPPRRRRPDAPTAPVQETGRRPARALPYDLAANAACDGKALTVALSNMSKDVACVFQLYDVLHLDALPQRHTVGPGRGAEAVYTLPAGRRLRSLPARAGRFSIAALPAPAPVRWWRSIAAA